MINYLNVIIFFACFFRATLNFAFSDSHSTSEEWPTCDNSFLNGTYTIMHKLYCDRYFECSNGQPHLMKCEKGYAYSLYKGCKLIQEVDCGNRMIIRDTNISGSGSGDCPTLSGLAEDKHGCGKYTICYNGTAYSGQCPNSLVYDDKGKFCRNPTPEEKHKCLPPPALLGCTLGSDGVNQGSCTWFQCPALNILPFGDHSKHPYPGHCQYYIKCYKEGNIRIEMCPPGSGFNEVINRCDSESKVPTCILQQPTSSSSSPYVLPQQQPTTTPQPLPSYTPPQQQTPPPVLTFPSYQPPQQQSTQSPLPYVPPQQSTSPPTYPSYSPPLQQTSAPSWSYSSPVPQSPQQSISYPSFSSLQSQIITARPN